ncbi:leucine rich repeat-containing protein [Toxoplasma gondii CAST]|uniref:Leucine rich repeat-containing protein n=1 Tax=Toxoplasma gondii CAST TaxID=943122 RepID=A0A3R8ARX2_TOXGO|nr:leucine rich repeat-containing protein [Toxoplasma gondii CAST]
MDASCGRSRALERREKGERVNENAVSLCTPETMTATSPSYSSLPSSSSQEVSSDPSSPSTPCLRLAASVAPSLPVSPASGPPCIPLTSRQIPGARSGKDNTSLFSHFLSPSGQDLLCLLLQFLSLHDILDRLLPAARLLPVATAFRTLHRLAPPKRLRPAFVQWALPGHESPGESPPRQLSPSSSSSLPSFPENPSVTFYTPPSSRDVGRLCRLTLTPQHLSLVHQPSLSLLLSCRATEESRGAAARIADGRRGEETNEDAKAESRGGGASMRAFRNSEDHRCSANRTHANVVLSPHLESGGWEIELACFSVQHWKHLRASKDLGDSPVLPSAGRGQGSETEGSRGDSLSTQRSHAAAAAPAKDPEVKPHASEAVEGPERTTGRDMEERQGRDAERQFDCDREAGLGLGGAGDRREAEERRECFPLLACSGALSALRISASEVNRHAVKVLRETVMLALAALARDSERNTPKESQKEKSPGDRSLSALAGRPASPHTIGVLSSSTTESPCLCLRTDAPLDIPSPFSSDAIFAAVSLHHCGVSAAGFHSLCVSVLPLLGSRLLRLSLTNCRLVAADMSSLSLALLRLPRLEFLDLSDNLLQDSGAVQVLLALVSSHRLFSQAAPDSPEPEGRDERTAPGQQSLASPERHHAEGEDQNETSGDDSDEGGDRGETTASLLPGGRLKGPLHAPQSPGRRGSARPAADLSSHTSAPESPPRSQRRARDTAGLLSLNLSGNDIEGGPLFRAVLKAYVERHAPNLEVLDLSNNTIDGETVLLLRAAVAHRRAAAAARCALRTQQTSELAEAFSGPLSRGGAEGTNAVGAERKHAQVRRDRETVSQSAASARKGVTRCSRDGRPEAERPRETHYGKTCRLSSPLFSRLEGERAGEEERQEEAERGKEGERGEEAKLNRKKGEEKGVVWAGGKAAQGCKRRRSQEVVSRVSQTAWKKRRTAPEGEEEEAWRGLVIDLRENFCRCVNSSSGETQESHARRPVGCLGVIDNTLLPRQKWRRSRREQPGSPLGKELKQRTDCTPDWQCGFLLDVCDCHLRRRKEAERGDSPLLRRARSLENHISSWGQPEREAFLHLLSSDATFAADVLAACAIQTPPEIQGEDPEAESPEEEEGAEEEEVEDEDSEAEDKEEETRSSRTSGEELETAPADTGLSGASRHSPARASSPHRDSNSLPAAQWSWGFLSLSPKSATSSDSRKTGAFSLVNAEKHQPFFEAGEAGTSRAASSPPHDFQSAGESTCKDMPLREARLVPDDPSSSSGAPGPSWRVSPCTRPAGVSSLSQGPRETSDCFFAEVEAREGEKSWGSNGENSKPLRPTIPSLPNLGVPALSCSLGVADADTCASEAACVALSSSSAGAHNDRVLSSSSALEGLSRHSDVSARAASLPAEKTQVWSEAGRVDRLSTCSSVPGGSVDAGEDRESLEGRLEEDRVSSDSSTLLGGDEEDEEEEEDGDERCFLFRGRNCRAPASVLLRKKFKQLQKRVSKARESSLSPRSRIRARVLRRLVADRDAESEAPEAREAEIVCNDGGVNRKNNEGLLPAKRQRGEGWGSENEGEESGGQPAGKRLVRQEGENRDREERERTGELDGGVVEVETCHRQKGTAAAQQREGGVCEKVERATQEGTHSRENTGDATCELQEDDDESYDESEDESGDESGMTDSDEDDVDEEEVNDLLLDAAEEVEECFMSSNRGSRRAGRSRCI